MTNERAIELLHRISDSQFDGEHGDERREALSMAVRVLEGDGDTISRQQAIEAFEPDHYIDWYTPTIIDTLEALPSVQPEMLACGNGELVKGSDGLVNDLVKDCISRQQAIDVLKGLPTWWADGGGYYGGAQPPMVALLDPEDAVSAIENLPAAQPERKNGRWIWWYEEAFTEYATEYTPHCKCSKCGRECAPSVATSSNFCRNCGADMRGESDEN